MSLDKKAWQEIFDKAPVSIVGKATKRFKTCDFCQQPITNGQKYHTADSLLARLVDGKSELVYLHAECVWGLDDLPDSEVPTL